MDGLKDAAREYKRWVSEDFLELVWGDGEGYFAMPSKVGNEWVEVSYEWDDETDLHTVRVETCLRDHEDLYYAPALFRTKGRHIGDVQPLWWLWADLDTVHPTSAAKINYLPSIAIESSPGRYQALWRLDTALTPRAHEKLNRGLSYVLDADHGGWDLTQVLRVPGTMNYKYDPPQQVKLMWVKDLVYSPRAMWDDLKAMLPGGELKEATGVVIPKRPIPRKAKQLLKATHDQIVVGERSARLWELECLLLEAGCDQEETFDLVWSSAWATKYRSRRGGAIALQKEIHRAYLHVSRKIAERPRPKPAEKQPLGADDAVPESNLPRFISATSFLSTVQRPPKWMVEDIWTAHSHGIIGGEPKTAKTTIGLALALAVASGKPFLGRWPVRTPGPALFIQEENNPSLIQDRLRKLSNMYGLLNREEAIVRPARPEDLARKGSVIVEIPAGVTEVPLWLANNQQVNLAHEDHRDWLVDQIETIKPRLVVIDPLYLTLDADTDKAAEMRPFLQWLLALQHNYSCAVILIHHMRKHNNARGTVRPGQNLLGSTTLHAWIASAIYMTNNGSSEEGWISLKMDREYRAMAPQRPINLDLSMGDQGTLDMQVVVTEAVGVKQLESLTEAAGEDGLRLTPEFLNKIGLTRARVARMAERSRRLEFVPGRQGRGHVSRLVAVSGNGSVK